MVFLVQGQRANSVLYVEESDNYVYITQKKRKEVWYMSCHFSSCPGRAKMFSIPEDQSDIDFSTIVILRTKEHNHPPEEQIKQVKELKERILEICRTESGDMCQIFKKECAKVPVEVASKLEWTKFYFSMRKVRKSQLPPEPSTLFEMDAAITSAMSRFGMAGGEEFYHGTVEADGKASLIFVTTQLIPVLRASELWHMEVTSQMVPKQPTGLQLLTIMANDGDRAYPVVYALMPCDETSAYMAVFEKLRSEFDLAPKAIMTDYDESLRCAIQEAYPTANIKGSWFHFAQAVIKCIVTNGLKTTLNHDRAFGNIIKMIISLALLPPEDMERGLAHVKRCISEANLKKVLEPIFKYFQEYWMEKVRPENFSVSGSNIRIINSYEAYQAQLAKYLGNTHPGIWKFVDGLIEIASKNVRDQQRFADGDLMSLARNSKWSFNEKTISNRLRDLERGNITVQRFLNYSSRFFHLEGISNYYVN